MNSKKLAGRLGAARSTAILAWSVVVAYSLAPFDFGLHSPVLADGWLLREAGADINPLDITVHLLAFSVVALLSRGAVGGGSRLDQPDDVRIAWQLALCVSIEAAQLLLPSRHASIVDLGVNSVGLMLGHVVAPSVFGHGSIAAAYAGPIRLQQLRHALLVVWAAFWLLSLTLPQRLVRLDDWDRGYPLIVGNERGGDRPWAGEIQYVAVYDRALPAAEVEDLAQPRMTASGGSQARSVKGPLLAYDFRWAAGGEVRPVGMLGDSSPRIRLGTGAEWVNSRVGVKMDHAVLSPEAPNDGLLDRIVSAGAFSIEVRCRPADLTQRGPARIVGSSDGPLRRNFSLAQEGSALVFRVRNYFNGPNGTDFELTAENALSGQPAHIIATYSRGVSTIFLDGRALTPRVDLRGPAVLLGLGATRASHIVTGILAVLSLVPLVNRA